MPLAILLTLAFLQPSSCGGEDQALANAAARADAFDPEGAVAQLDREPLGGCARAQVAVAYLRGLIAARRAYGRGGDAKSLEPVRDAGIGLDARARAGSRPAEIASLVLRAAASAAQSEREEMAVLLEHALRTELLQLTAGSTGAPIITAHEAAGDLWLQVHQYDRARDAYRNAVERLGPKPRLTVGLARVAARSKQRDTACAEYRSLLERWRWAAQGPAEIDEARLFIRREC